MTPTEIIQVIIMGGALMIGVVAYSVAKYHHRKNL